MTSPLNVGDTIKVAEPDYCYGVGELDYHALRGIERDELTLF